MARNAKNAKNNRKGAAVAEADSPGNGPLSEADETPYRHYVEGDRLTSDGAFFELLLTRVLQEQGSLANFEDTWPRAAQALAGLNPYRLSQFSINELETIIGTVGGEFTDRMARRAGNIIAWAETFWNIKQIYGSFRQYVRSFDVDGADALVEDLNKRLPGVSPQVILSVLRTSGEKIPNLAQYEGSSSGDGRQGKSRSGKSGGQSRGRGQSGRGRRRGRGGNKGKSSSGQTSGAKSQSQAPQKGGEAKKDKGGAKKRKGRRPFFRRKRGASGSSQKQKGSPDKGGS